MRPAITEEDGAEVLRRKTRDAVVVGAGPNGLVAANLLADAGWNVLLVESQAQLGGAVASDSDVAEGYIHDTFSSFYPLAAASPVIQHLGLEDFGLRWRHAPAVLGHPLPSGDWALLHHDATRTAAELDQAHPGDGEAWMRLYDDWSILGPALISTLLSPFPPVRAGLGLLAKLGRVGMLDWLHTMVEPAGTLARSRFGSEAARLLVAGNAMHADIPLTAPGSGLFGLLLAMLGQTVGFPVPQGGAGKLASALADRFTERGGEIRLNTRVRRITTSNRRATGVLQADGEHVAARAVIADVAATALYGGLVPWPELPAKVRRRMASFEQDPATIKVDWALSSPVPWASRPNVMPGTVHIADSMNQLTRAQDLIANNVVPAEPFLLVGQMSSTDPTRSPACTESLWAYTRVPQLVHDDEGGQLVGTWDHDETERLADRMQARLERYAPGFSSAIVARRVLGPRQLQARDENLISGALGGGTSGLHQQLIFRPIPGLGRADTAVRGLFLGSASAHPGGGVHGACGANAARAVLAAARSRLL